MSDTTSRYSVVYAFGDSTTDAGNVSIATGGSEPVSPPYNTQTYGSVSAAQYSNGPVWVQDLSQDLGLGTLAPSRAGGTDFAYGGAETGPDPQNAGNTSTQMLSVPVQLSQFAAAIGQASPNALFALSVGGGDILDIVNKNLTTQQQASDVTAAVNNELSDISTMYGDGMRNIVVMNVEDLGLFPVTTKALVAPSFVQAAFDSVTSTLAASYNAQLASGLASLAASDGFNYNLVDAYSVDDSAVSNPLAYGYSNVTTPVWSGSFTSDTGGVLSSNVTAVQNRNLFFDQYHLTETGHADYANIAYTETDPTYVGQADLNTGVNTLQIAQPYAGPDLGLHTEFSAVTPDNVGLFASTPGTFLQTGTGDNILVAQSGNNVLATSTGSSYLESGTGTDTFYTSASPTTPSWNEIVNFHSGDVLSVTGFRPGVSVAVWTTDPGIDGAVLNVNVAGTGGVWASDTFVGVSMSTAQNYLTSETPVSGTGVYTVIA